MSSAEQPDVTIDVGRESTAVFDPADRDRVLKLSLDMLCVIRFDGTFKSLSPDWSQVLNHPEQQLLSGSLLDFVHPDDRERTAAELAKLAEDETRVSFENRYQRGDDTYASLCWTAMPDAPSEVIHAIVRDVTEEKEREAEIRQSETRFRTLIESAPQAILVADWSGRILLVNPHAVDLFGYSEDELVGTSVDMLLPLNLRQRHANHRETFGRAPQPRMMGHGLDLVAERKNGTRFAVTVGLSLIEMDGDQAIATFVADISERKRIEEELLKSNELRVRLDELQRLRRESDELGELTELLQACVTVPEAYQVIDRYARRLFPHASGAVHVVSASGTLAEEVTAWGNRLFGPAFEIEGCWALRRGRVHVVDDPATMVSCSHLTDQATSYACVPMVAQGQSLGVIHSCRPAGTMSNPDQGSQWSRMRQLASEFADHAALGLSNLNLRASLRSHAIRDPLTKLFNRRYLEETVERELRRADREGAPVGVVMIDLDQFKALNDSFGHHAGDVVLREFATILTDSTRADDLACRYGGEEFVLVLPGASAETSRDRANSLREELRRRVIDYPTGPLSDLSLSAGVVAHPQHGTTFNELLRAADSALYEAKAQGRNRVHVSADGREQGNGRANARAN